MTSWTIKKRLMRSLMGFVALFWIGGVAVAALVVRHEIDEMFDSTLREATAQLIPIALQEYHMQATTKPADVAEAHSQSLRVSRGHVHFFLHGPDGKVLLASAGAPETRAAGVPERGFSNEGGYRYYSRFLPSEKVWIVVAQDLRERKEAATGLWIGLASPLLALLPIAAFAVWWTVGRATEPISRVSSELEARGGDHLEPIDAAGLPAELTPVIEAVNTLMKRLKAALDSERAFAANAAHELRNPIASARAQVQLLAGNLRGTTDSARAENIASQLGQLGRRIEKLLQMSRATAGLGHARERTDLFAITGLIADDYKRRPDVGDRLQLEPGNGTDCWVAMDPDALAIVVRNAVENAVHHGADGEPIKVRVEAGHALHIVNACPVVPSETLQELKARFRRGGLSRTTGSGLGLAIVDTLMRQAGGSATLASPAGGRQDGFEIVLKFPGAL